MRKLNTVLKVTKVNEDMAVRNGFFYTKDGSGVLPRMGCPTVVSPRAHGFLVSAGTPKRGLLWEQRYVCHVCGLWGFCPPVYSPPWGVPKGHAGVISSTDSWPGTTQ